MDGNIEGVKRQDEIIKEVADFLIARTAPEEFASNDPKNVLVQMELSFASVCAAMELEGVSSPKTLSLFDYHTRLIHLQKRAKQS